MKEVLLVYQLAARSGVLIGSTADALGIGIDKASIRRRRVGSVPKQEPLIPGSTLKGKIRNEAERILTTFRREVCRPPRADTMCPHDPRVKDPPCPICQLFGGPAHRSRLCFDDAIVKVNTRIAPYLTRLQAGVALSRTRRTAEDKRLYYLERGVEALVYEGQIDGYLEDDLAEQQVALTVLAIERLLAIGGSKSRGAGWIHSRVTSIHFDGGALSAEQSERIREQGIRTWRE